MVLQETSASEPGELDISNIPFTAKMQRQFFFKKQRPATFGRYCRMLLDVCRFPLLLARFTGISTPNATHCKNYKVQWASGILGCYPAPDNKSLLFSAVHKEAKKQSCKGS